MSAETSISVIIPVHNVELYLAECLDTILKQTAKDLEIICINDGSTDNSGKILDEYSAKDKRIKVVHSANKGVSATRNVGLALAKGRYISFIDADDWIAPDFYENLLKNEVDFPDIIQGGIKFCGGSGKTLTCSSPLFVRNSGFAQIVANMPKCYTCNKLWKNSFIKEHNLRFAEDIRYCEDVLFTIQAAFLADSWKFVDYTGYFYRINATSVSNSPTKEAMRRNHRIIVIERALSFASQQNFSASDRQALEDFLARQLIGDKEALDLNYIQQLTGMMNYPDILYAKHRKAKRKQMFRLSYIKAKISDFITNLWRK